MKKPLAILLAVIGAAWPVGAQNAARGETRTDHLARLLATLQPIPAPALAPAANLTGDEPTLLLATTPAGYLTHVGAPPGYAFPSGATAPGQPVQTATAFLRAHAALLGSGAPAVDFALVSANPTPERQYLRLQQTYAGIPIVAGEVVVQLTPQDDVEAVLADVAHESLDWIAEGRLELVPTVPADGAVVIAQAHFQEQAEGERIGATEPRLSLFAPEVLDETGEPQLVWDFQVSTASGEHVAHRVLVDAHSGAMARAWQLSCNARNRRVFDGQNTTGVEVLARDEGDAASGIAQVDRAYVHLSEVWSYYSTVHSRDSYDGAGARIEATVRFCSANCGCPCANAFSGNASSVTSGMVFGNNWVTDDVIAHEFTHRVTQLTSGLIYTNASGAMNESFSDIWGEYVDLNNNSQGSDAASVRWLVGEDLLGGAIRSMTNPPAFNDPDRLGSSLYQQPSNTSDNGGVHRNSGVGNKLAFLLTDGNTFNGQTVSSMGINTTARLFYEAQVNILTSGANYFNLGNALRQAAVNLGWSQDNQNNVLSACRAVEIVGSAGNYYVDKTSACLLTAGVQTCVLFTGPWKTLTEGVTGIPAGNVLQIRGANYNEPQTIRKAMTIRGYTGTVNLGKP